VRVPPVSVLPAEQRLDITLTQGPGAASKHWNPLHTDPFAPPSNFADQITDPGSPLFLNTSVSNTLFTLPPAHATTGIPALASSVGIRPEDAFDIAATLFVLIIAGTVAVSLLVFGVDTLVGTLVRASGRTSGTRTPPWASAHKEFTESLEPNVPDDDVVSGTVRFIHRPASRTLQILPPPRGWLNYRLGQSSFHGSVLHGNLVRILVLFHLPVSVFACYQFSTGRSQSSLAGVVLAALVFAVCSLGVPAWLVMRVWTTPTAKLYDETRTLLMLGPLYNEYAHGSQLFGTLFFATNVVYAVVLGCGQQSGSAQAIIVLVVEVGVALTTSVWMPWGRGAAMGGISFMFCVARVITAVLLVILSPVVSVGDAAGGWIAYAILVIQGLVYLSFFVMLVSKLAEGVVRYVWDVPFARSKHTVDTGLLGALGLAPCCGRRRRTDGGRHSQASSLSAASAVSPANAGASRRAQSPPHILPSVPVQTNAAAAQSHTTVPSVLRPEQLNQPYREDSDDEGYILGAWHYEDEPGEPGATPPGSLPGTPTPGASASGFSRVAGGRANIESPFTMAAASLSSVDTGASSSAGALSAGAMGPGRLPHTRARIKSQTAVIELADAQPYSISITRTEATADTPGHANPNIARAAIKGPRAPEQDPDDFPLPHAARRRRRRRRWPGLALFSSAAKEDEDEAEADAAAHAGEAAAAPMERLLPEAASASSPDHVASASASSPGGEGASRPPSSRTFIVIRDRRPRPSPLSQTHTTVPGDSQPP